MRTEIRVGPAVHLQSDLQVESTLIHPFDVARSIHPPFHRPKYFSAPNPLSQAHFLTAKTTGTSASTGSSTLRRPTLGSSKECCDGGVKTPMVQLLGAVWMKGARRLD